MQAIVTKYLGPTNSKGSRIRASCDAGSITIPFDYALGTAGRHRQAAEALIAKLDWGEYGPVVGGWVGNDMIFVFVERGE